MSIGAPCFLCHQQICICPDSKQTESSTIHYRGHAIIHSQDKYWTLGKMYGSLGNAKKEIDKLYN